MKGLIFTYVLTYGGAAISLVNPYVGLLIYVCFSIIKPEALWHWAVPSGNYSRIVAIALLIGWLFRGFGDWRLGRARGIVLLLVGFAAWNALSATFAINSTIAWAAVEQLAKIVLPFLAGITLIDSVNKARLLAWVIVASQGYVALEMNLAYYDGFNRVIEVGFGGMDNNCVAIAMVTCTGLAFFLGLQEWNWFLKIAALVACLLMVHTVMFAFSRGGMLALILTTGVAFLLIPKRPVHIVILLAAVLVGVRLAGPEVLARFGTTFADETARDESAESRLRMWRDCWDVMQNHPATGLGPRNWPLVAASYGWSPGKEAHSLWLQTGAELGFPGLAMLVGFYLWCVVKLWPLARGRIPVADHWIADLARAVVASIFGFAVAAQFVSLAGLEAPYYIVLIGAGTLKLADLSPKAADASAHVDDHELADAVDTPSDCAPEMA